MQVVQVSDLVVAEYLPASQSGHTVRPTEFPLNLPAAQSVQDADSELEENLPTGQREQMPDVAVEKLPASQGMQAAPGVAEPFPAGQLSQLVALAREVLPVGQSVHADDPAGANFPATHAVQADVPTDAATLPPSQFWQSWAPAVGPANLPIGQMAQAVWPNSNTPVVVFVPVAFPTSQLAQLLCSVNGWLLPAGHAT